MTSDDSVLCIQACVSVCSCQYCMPKLLLQLVPVYLEFCQTFAQTQIQKRTPTPGSWYLSTFQTTLKLINRNSLILWNNLLSNFINLFRKQFPTFSKDLIFTAKSFLHASGGQRLYSWPCACMVLSDVYHASYVNSFFKQFMSWCFMLRVFC